MIFILQDTMAQPHVVRSTALHWRHNDHDSVSNHQLTVVYLTVYSDADQRKHQSSASLAFVWGIHRDRWIPRTKGQVRGKCFHLMTSSWTLWFWGINPSPLGFFYWNYAWTLISNHLIMSWILHFEMRLLEQEICHLPSVCVSKVLNSLV